LLDVVNVWDEMVEGGIAECPRVSITVMGVEKAIGWVKTGRAGGSTQLVE